MYIHMGTWGIKYGCTNRSDSTHTLISFNTTYPWADCQCFSYSFAKFNTSRLEDAGHHVGERILELVCLRDRLFRRENRLVPMLQVSPVKLFISADYGVYATLNSKICTNFVV